MSKCDWTTQQEAASLVPCPAHYQLQVVESKMYEWWKRNVNAVRKSIDGRRASISNLIKQSFMYKFP